MLVPVLPSARLHQATLHHGDRAPRLPRHGDLQVHGLHRAWRGHRPRRLIVRLHVHQPPRAGSAAVPGLRPGLQGIQPVLLRDFITIIECRLIRQHVDLAA
jgi:hypothetical protein